MLKHKDKERRLRVLGTDCTHLHPALCKGFASTVLAPPRWWYQLCFDDEAKRGEVTCPGTMQQVKGPLELQMAHRSVLASKFHVLNHTGLWPSHKAKFGLVPLSQLQATGLGWQIGEVGKGKQGNEGPHDRDGAGPGARGSSQCPGPQE